MAKVMSVESCAAYEQQLGLRKLGGSISDREWRVIDRVLRQVTPLIPAIDKLPSLNIEATHTTAAMCLQPEVPVLAKETAPLYPMVDLGGSGIPSQVRAARSLTMHFN